MGHVENNFRRCVYAWLGDIVVLMGLKLFRAMLITQIPDNLDNLNA